MRDRDAGDGGPPDVIIRDQEGAGYRSQHADLVTGVREVRPDGRLDLADDLERARAHDGNARTPAGLRVPAPRYRSHGQAAAVGGDTPPGGLGEVVPQVEPAGALNRPRCPGPGAVRERPRPVTAGHLNAGMRG